MDACSATASTGPARAWLRICPTSAWGDEQLTPAQFERLLGQASGVVRFRGQYVYLHPAEIEQLRARLARPADALHRSLTEPTAGLMPINRPVRITMKDGRTIVGRRLNEDTFTVQVIDDKERLHSIVKADARTIVVDTKSNMPSFAGKLTDEELSDVIAYLLTLKGQLP